MALADWSLLADAASSSSIKREPVTAAVVTPPNGGGTFTLAMHSLVNAAGVVGYYSALTNFAPTDSGADVTGTVSKAGSAGTLHSEFLFACLGGPNSTDNCYLLGLSDSEPAHIILRKGQLAYGCPDVAPGTQGVLRRSAATFAKGKWVHLKLEVIVQPNGDALINVYQSDLGAHVVGSPSWAAIAGMAAFTDDAAQINTGSAPLVAGRMGFAMVSAEINRIGAFDEITTARQILP